MEQSFILAKGENMFFSIVRGFLLGMTKLPLWFYAAILAVILIAGGFFYAKGKIIDFADKRCQESNIAKENDDLKRAIFEIQQYNSFLLSQKSKNETYIEKQRKALKNANDEDGHVAPILRNTLERLR